MGVEWSGVMKIKKRWRCGGRKGKGRRRGVKWGGKEQRKGALWL